MQEWIVLAAVMLLGLAGYWSLVIFPKQREFNKRQRLVRTLAEGDEVITASGFIARVIEIRGDEGIAVVEIAPGVRVRAVARHRCFSRSILRNLPAMRRWAVKTARAVSSMFDVERRLVGDRTE
ncbi:MAG: preprotein translocase subunit YajC [Chloroflexi bacterium]|nr:preprotein translocase subunit YajC [Chloroflexota bacterium]